MNTVKNYNGEAFNDKNSELVKLNNANISELNSSGKCNTCTHFNFGARKCNLKNKDLPITLTTETSKGNFISFIKPLNCTDFKKKNSKINKKQST